MQAEFADGNSLNQPLWAQEDLYEQVKKTLPQIDARLRVELREEFQKAYNQRFEEERQRVEAEADREVEKLVSEIERNTVAQIEAKLQELQIQMQGLDAVRDGLEADVISSLEKKIIDNYEKEKQFLVKSVVEEVNLSGVSEELERKIRERLRHEYQEEVREELQKKEKTIKLQLKKKMEIEKKNLEEFYAREWNAKVDQQKKLLEQERAELGRIKSLNNVRLAKFQAEKKQLQQQLQEQEQKYLQLITGLQSQISKIEKDNDDFLSESVHGQSEAEDYKYVRAKVRNDGGVARDDRKLSDVILGPPGQLL